MKNGKKYLRLKKTTSSKWKEKVDFIGLNSFIISIIFKQVEVLKKYEYYLTCQKENDQLISHSA